MTSAPALQTHDRLTPARPLHILIVHPDQETATQLEKVLASSSEPDFDVLRVSTINSALHEIGSAQVDTAFISLKLEHAYERIQELDPTLPIVLLDIPEGEVISLMQEGAQDFLYDDELELGRLVQTIRCAIIRQERRTRSSHQADLLANLLEKLPDRIYFKDLASRFVKVNNSMAKLFGLDDPADLVGRTDFDFFTEEHAQGAYEDEQRLISGDLPLISKVEKETFTGGRVAWALTNKMPLRSNEGQIIGTFGISHDVTQLHEMEESLQAERNRLKSTSAELIEKNTQLEADMAMAREIQLALLPTQYPRFPADSNEEDSRLHFEHRYIPAHAVGGDFFTVFPITDTKAGVLICDVMGHGSRAAMVTAIVRALREELKPVAPFPDLFLSGLNSGIQSILRRVEDPMLATGIYLIIDSETGHVEFASAGHPSPIHLQRSSQKATPIQEYDSRHGPVLGLYDEVSYPRGEFSMNPGDALILFTDGLFEVPCDDSDEYGYPRLVGQLASEASLATERLLDVTLAHVMGHASDGFDDDVCLVAVERVAPKAND